VFPHKDRGEVDLILRAFSLDGEIVLRETAEVSRSAEAAVLPQGGRRRRAGYEYRTSIGAEVSASNVGSASFFDACTLAD
jgi:hypothetical protein